MSGTDATSVARRMSAEEAAAQADALIAQHRAGRSPARRAPRAAPTTGSGSSGLRSAVLALLVLGVVTGLAWRSAPLLAVGVGLVAVVLAFRIVRALPGDGSSGPTSR